MVAKINRFDVCLISLDPTVGSEIRKTRPGVIISPDEMNHNLNTVIVAPMTTSEKNYPTRIPLVFENKSGYIALDQIRTIDKTRIIKRLGMVNLETQEKIVSTLVELFAL